MPWLLPEARGRRGASRWRQGGGEGRGCGWFRAPSLACGHSVPSRPQACAEIDAIGMEKRRVLQQWTACLVGMKRRDEAHRTIQEVLRYGARRASRGTPGAGGGAHSGEGPGCHRAVVGPPGPR